MRLTTASGRRLVAGIPILWLLVLFLIPFIIVFRISFSEVRLAIPPYTPLLSWRHGAWELQLRYSRLDLVDGDFHGGGPPFTQGASVRNITLGVNWFLNAHAKMGVDFVHSTRADLGNARYDVIEARLACSL